jgi:hypothetical protein
MLPYTEVSPWIIAGCLMFCAMAVAPAGDTKDLVRQAKAALRAAENTNEEREA